MDFGSVNTVGAALVAGCVTSVHCVGMCGPLACAVMPAPGRGSAAARGTVYHLGRMLSYSTLGAVAGLLGTAPLSFLKDSGAWLAPWVLVIAFLLVALGWEQKIPRPAFLSKGIFRLRLRSSALGGGTAAFLLGSGTPLIPCGPLYLMLGIALASGSALRGAEFCLAFSLGTVPLLWLAQSQMGVLRHRLGPRGLRGLQRGAALAAALVLTWRLMAPVMLSGQGVPACCP